MGYVTITTFLDQTIITRVVEKLRSILRCVGSECNCDCVNFVAVDRSVLNYDCLCSITLLTRDKRRGQRFFYNEGIHSTDKCYIVS